MRKIFYSSNLGFLCELGVFEGEKALLHAKPQRTQSVVGSPDLAVSLCFDIINPNFYL